ncbi:MAG TPA: hypothetical protein PKN95_07020 [Verrucomicrobiota bacterium]|nr:hypothetical protein [Verrucomicrobiota bacterium]HNT13414.1 hypothetical protein [Verrucomicrobiota bacterium]
MKTQSLETPWFILGLHLGLWFFIILLALQWRGAALPFHDRAQAVAYSSPIPLAALPALFASETWARNTNPAPLLGPFATRHFIPVTPPVPPPTTRKIALVYQGFYTTPNAEKVFLESDKQLMVFPIGGQIAPTLFVAGATPRELTLTNTAAQTNVLKLNTATTLEVPIK